MERPSPKFRKAWIFRICLISSILAILVTSAFLALTWPAKVDVLVNECRLADVLYVELFTREKVRFISKITGARKFEFAERLKHAKTRSVLSNPWHMSMAYENVRIALVLHGKTYGYRIPLKRGTVVTFGKTNFFSKQGAASDEDVFGLVPEFDLISNYAIDVSLFDDRTLGD